MKPPQHAGVNHSVLDGVAGAIVALAGLWVARRITKPLVELDLRLRRGRLTESPDDDPVPSAP